MKRVRVAILGCGRIAEFAHLPALRSLRDVELAAVADGDEARLARGASLAPGAARFSGYEAAIDEGRCDAAVITLPPALHADAAIAALRAGLHVYLEKPVAITAAQAEAVVRTWRETGLVGMIGFNFRFHPALVRARDLLTAGAAGEVLGVQTAFTVPPREAIDWRSLREAGGGALLDLGSHHVDLVSFLFDTRVTGVHAGLQSIRSDHDRVFLELETDAGFIVQSFLSLDAPLRDEWSIHGRGGRIVIDRVADRVAVHRGASSGAAPAAGRVGRALRSVAHGFRRHDPSYRTALAHFIDAVREGGPVRPDLADGERCLHILLAAETGGLLRTDP